MLHGFYFIFLIIFDLNSKKCWKCIFCIEIDCFHYYRNNNVERNFLINFVVTVSMIFLVTYFNLRILSESAFWLQLGALLLQREDSSTGIDRAEPINQGCLLTMLEPRLYFLAHKLLPCRLLMNGLFFFIVINLFITCCNHFFFFNLTWSGRVLC